MECDSNSVADGCGSVSSGRWREKNWCSFRSCGLTRGCTGAKGDGAVRATNVGGEYDDVSPCDDELEPIEAPSSFGEVVDEGEVFSALVDVSTFLALLEAGTTLGDLDELK